MHFGLEQGSALAYAHTMVDYEAMATKSNTKKIHNYFDDLTFGICGQKIKKNSFCYLHIVPDLSVPDWDLNMRFLPTSLPRIVQIQASCHQDESAESHPHHY